MKQIGIAALLLLAPLAACGGGGDAQHASSSTASGQGAYEHHLVRRPGTSVDDQKVYYVDQGRKHWVVTSAWVTAHGFQWPKDVQTIPAADLAAIPDGTPVR